MKFITLFLSLFNIKKMKSSTTMQIIQSHAIMNFLFAADNLPPHSIINNVFSGNIVLINHFHRKLDGPCHGSLITLFGEELNESEREKVIRWIMENYKGIDVANVAAYYIENEEEKLKRLDSLTKDGLNHG